MMFRKIAILKWPGVLACLAIAVSVHAADNTVRIDAAHRQFFENHCIECHNAKKTKGKTRLDPEAFSFDIKTVEDADKWQTILEAINAGEMPPDDEPQPKAADKLAFLDMLSTTLVEARAVLSDSGGKVVMRRLNRREYSNTIQHILGVEIDVADLPDDHSEGFDTDGASLFMSPYQVEQYMDLGREALQAAMQEEYHGKRLSLRIEPELKLNPFIEKRADGYRTRYEAAKAFEASQAPNKHPKDFGLLDERDVSIAKSFYSRFFGTYDYYRNHPLAKSGVLLSLWHPKPMEVVSIGKYKERVALTPPKDGKSRYKDVQTPFPEGIYTIRARVAKTAEATPERCFLDFGQTGAGAEFQRQNTFHITASIDDPQIVEAQVVLTRRNRQFAFREKSDDGTARYKYSKAHKTTRHGAEFAIWMDWYEFEGPFPREKTAMAQRLSTMFRPGARVVAGDVKLLLRDFAALAFRGVPEQAAYLTQLYTIYEAELASGKQPREAILEPLSIVLASPAFLYLSEPVTKGKRRMLSQRELAVRLSYFLWSAPPDEALLALAQAGELKADVLKRQVNRLLDSPHAENFYRSFAYQWLDMERLSLFQFDVARYTEFDDTLKSAAAEEIYQTLKVIIEEDLSSRTLLDSDFVVVNALLAQHYGLADVEGEEFRKVALPEDSIRGGLTSMAAVLAMGSDGKETSPVERGSWVLRKILNQPPPPAPANVPQLSRLEGKRLSVRKMLAAHQEEPQCAHCHKRIDPIGFGLENFDATGLWRTEDRLNKVKVAINPAGRLYKGETFASYAELKEIFVDKLDPFNRGLIEQMLSYSLGRPVGFSDQELIDGLEVRMTANNNSIRALIQGIVQSKSFRSKK
ncbi:MAG: hypothetical protein ACI8W8_003596 [Rhodothermales bacterium]|jgi:hypothetical protein